MGGRSRGAEGHAEAKRLWPSPLPLARRRASRGAAAGRAPRELSARGPPRELRAHTWRRRPRPARRAPWRRPLRKRQRARRGPQRYFGILSKSLASSKPSATSPRSTGARSSRTTSGREGMSSRSSSYTSPKNSPRPSPSALGSQVPVWKARAARENPALRAEELPSSATRARRQASSVAWCSGGTPPAASFARAPSVPEDPRSSRSAVPSSSRNAPASKCGGGGCCWGRGAREGEPPPSLCAACSHLVEELPAGRWAGVLPAAAPPGVLPALDRGVSFSPSSSSAFWCTASRVVGPSPARTAFFLFCQPDALRSRTSRNKNRALGGQSLLLERSCTCRKAASRWARYAQLGWSNVAPTQVRKTDRHSRETGVGAVRSSSVTATSTLLASMPFSSNAPTRRRLPSILVLCSSSASSRASGPRSPPGPGPHGLSVCSKESWHRFSSTRRKILPSSPQIFVSTNHWCRRAQSSAYIPTKWC
mmetsp:Transcript_86702/g.234973  ORF Transcript_86702/g.234973 Transcript_86702/m.234973 type:complete len:479 (+) Transcript_86702:245-1681(+)